MPCQPALYGLLNPKISMLLLNYMLPSGVILIVSLLLRRLLWLSMYRVGKRSGRINLHILLTVRAFLLRKLMEHSPDFVWLRLPQTRNLATWQKSNFCMFLRHLNVGELADC